MPKAADASRRSPSQRVASGSKLATLLTDEKTLQDPQNQDSEIEPGYQYDDALLVADTSAYDSAASRAVFSSGHSHDEASSSSKQDSASSNRKGSLALLLSPTLPDDEDRPPMSALDYFGGSTSPLIHESHEIRSDSSPFQNNLAPEPPVEPVASAVESQQVASIPTRSKIKYNPTRKTGSTAAFRKPITLAEWRALDKSSVNPLRPTISGEDPRERIFMQAGAMENGSSHEPLSRPTTPPLPATSNVSTRESTQYVPPPMPDIAAIAAGLIPVGSGMSARPQAPALPSPASHSRETGRRPSSKRPFTPGGYNGEPPAKRSKTTLVKTEDTVRSADAMNVAKHYNIRPNLGVDQRQLSPIIGLRSFNNWIKTVLINKYCKSPPEMMAEAAMINGHQDRRSVIQRRNLKVLDMGCGKGGDLMKWNQAFAERQADIADVSINQAISRIQSSHLRFDAKFYVADCYSNPLASVLPSTDLQKPFDVVTMQFCMHYAFQSEAMARIMLANVTKHLRYGGMFVGTIPDSHLLTDRLNALPDESSELSFGNAVYQITFETKKESLYGHRYTFYLQDAVDSVPEYVVYWEQFKSLAAEYGLSLVFYSPFADIFQDEQENPEFKELMKKMKVINDEGESAMDEDMFEAVNLYVCFAFTKT